MHGDVGHHCKYLRCLVGNGDHRKVGGICICAGVERGTKALHFARDVRRRARSGAARGQVGGHRGKAGMIGWIQRAAGIHAERRGNQRQAGTLRNNHTQAIGKGLLHRIGNLRCHGFTRRRSLLALIFRRECERRNLGCRNLDCGWLDGRCTRDGVAPGARRFRQVADGDAVCVVHEGAGHTLHIRDRDGLQLRQQPIRGTRILEDDHRARQVECTPV